MSQWHKWWLISANIKLVFQVDLILTESHLVKLTLTIHIMLSVSTLPSVNFSIDVSSS